MPEVSSVAWTFVSSGADTTSINKLLTCSCGRSGEKVVTIRPHILEGGS